MSTALAASRSSPSSLLLWRCSFACALRLVSIYASSQQETSSATQLCCRLGRLARAGVGPIAVRLNTIQPIASLRLVLTIMAKGGRRARQRRRRFVGQPRRRDLDRLRESESGTIAPKDESFDDCSFPDADARALARLALAAIDKYKCGKAMEILAHWPWGVQALRLLVDARPNIVSVYEYDEGEDSGGTLLHYAAGFTRPSLVAVLLYAGADPHALDANGRTTLAWACGNHELGASVVSCMLEHGADPRELHQAAHCNNVDVCKVLIATGVSVNARSATGQTPLEMAAANHAAPRCIAILLDAGAEVTREVVLAVMRNGRPRGLQLLFRAARRCVLWAFSYMYTQHVLWINVAYMQRMCKAGGCKAGA